jgi:hypothetical protein
MIEHLLCPVCGLGQDDDQADHDVEGHPCSRCGSTATVGCGPASTVHVLAVVEGETRSMRSCCVGDRGVS